MFPPFSVYMRQLLKGIWTKSGQYGDQELKFVEEAELLQANEKLLILKQALVEITSMQRKTKSNVICLLTLLKTRCV